MTAVANLEFKGWRALFWPIHRSELKKFVPMLLIFALIVFNYSLLRAAKDALILTAPAAGAATIPFIKVWAILPMAFLSTLIFTRLSNRFSRAKVFYLMMFGFLGFFFLFITIFYPLQNYLHPHAFADKCQAMLPRGFQGLIAIFRNWTFSLFYVMSELWGTIIMTVLFWGFANEVTSVKEAKRFYAIFGVGANLATTFAGLIEIGLSSKLLHSKIYVGGDRWGQSLILISTLIIITGLTTVFIYRWLINNGLKKEMADCKPLTESCSEKIKMGIRKNFAYLAKSKYLICIAILVLGYNMALNMVEVVWKHQVCLLYPYAADFNVYMAKVLTYIGITSTLFAIFLSGQFIRRFGWSFSAYLTPLIVLVTGMLFFIVVLFKHAGLVGTISALTNMTPLAFCAFLGSLQNVFTRSSKFTFFDVTKEMAFIPLSKESKLKGKAAIDGVGSRLGKSGGALIHQCLIIIFGTVAMSTPYVALLFIVVVLAWILAVRSLGHQFAEHSDHKPTKTPNLGTAATISGTP